MQKFMARRPSVGGDDDAAVPSFSIEDPEQGGGAHDLDVVPDEEGYSYLERVAKYAEDFDSEFVKMARIPDSSISLNLMALYAMRFKEVFFTGHREWQPCKENWKMSKYAKEAIVNTVTGGRFDMHYKIVGGQYERRTYWIIVYLWWVVHLVQLSSVFALIYETRDGWSNPHPFRDSIGFILFVASGLVVAFYIGSDWGNNYLFWSARNTRYADGPGCFIKLAWFFKCCINVGLMVSCVALSLKTADPVEYILDALGLLAIAEIDDLVAYYPAFANIANDATQCPVMKRVYHLQVKDRVAESIMTVKLNFFAYIIMGTVIKGF